MIRELSLPGTEHRVFAQQGLDGRQCLRAAVEARFVEIGTHRQSEEEEEEGSY